MTELIDQQLEDLNDNYFKPYEEKTINALRKFHYSCSSEVYNVLKKLNKHIETSPSSVSAVSYFLRYRLRQKDSEPYGPEIILQLDACISKTVEISEVETLCQNLGYNFYDLKSYNEYEEYKKSLNAQRKLESKFFKTPPPPTITKKYTSSFIKRTCKLRVPPPSRFAPVREIVDVVNIYSNIWLKFKLKDDTFHWEKEVDCCHVWPLVKEHKNNFPQQFLSAESRAIYDPKYKNSSNQWTHEVEKTNDLEFDERRKAYVTKISELIQKSYSTSNSDTAQPSLSTPSSNYTIPHDSEPVQSKLNNMEVDPIFNTENSMDILDTYLSESPYTNIHNQNEAPTIIAEKNQPDTFNSAQLNQLYKNMFDQSFQSDTKTLNNSNSNTLISQKTSPSIVNRKNSLKLELKGNKFKNSYDLLPPRVQKAFKKHHYNLNPYHPEYDTEDSYGWKTYQSN